MFEGKSVVDIFQMGGFTMYILAALGVISVAIMLERSFMYWFHGVDRREFMGRIQAELERGAYDVAVKICEMDRSPVAAVVEVGLRKRRLAEKDIQGAMEREIVSETVNLERLTSVVGVIGNVAVYIGLFGTVLGIVRAFNHISETTSGGLPVVINGIAEALICTATGLLVAVPSVAAHNFFLRRVDRFVADMDVVSSETLELLGASPVGPAAGGEKPA